MAEERKPFAGQVERIVPSQLDEADLRAEIELELPGSMDADIIPISDDITPSIEITMEEDGGVEVDFEPQDQRGKSDDFYANLAEEMPDRELGASIRVRCKQGKSSGMGRCLR